MLFALHNGKQGGAEDLLSSTAFQLLRYIPTAEGFLPILRRAHPVQCDWKIFEADSFEVELWPHLSRGCCPDVILTLKKSNQITQRILIEAKLFSGMTYRAEVDEPDEGEASPNSADSIDSNQLVRYWESFHRQCLAENIDHGIIYLTAHLTPPHKELDASWRPGMRLAWLSWYDVHAITAHLACLPGRDLAQILSDMGFATFTGFRRQTEPEFSYRCGRFFTPKILFDSTCCDLPQSGRFWSQS